MQSWREPVSGFTHLAGAILSLIGMIWLIFLTVHDVPKMISIIIFGSSMIILYLASTAMHLVNGFHGGEWIGQWLQRIDHAAIYVLIAGTYTPFCYNLLSGEWRWGMLGLVWGLAITGVVAKLIFFFQGHLSTLFYMAMGWLAVVFAPEFLPVIDRGAVVLVVAGGITYTVGAVIFMLNKPNFHRHFGYHELWHLFVLGGSAFHFFAILLYVV